MSIQTLKIDLATYKEELAQAEKELKGFEYSITDGEWDIILDETESDIVVCDILFSPSDVLKNCDPVAYRVRKSDYESNYDLDDCLEYKDIQERIEDLEKEIESLEEQIADLESEGE